MRKSSDVDRYTLGRYLDDAPEDDERFHPCEPLRVDSEFSDAADDREPADKLDARSVAAASIVHKWDKRIHTSMGLGDWICSSYAYLEHINPFQPQSYQRSYTSTTCLANGDAAHMSTAVSSLFSTQLDVACSGALDDTSSPRTVTPPLLLRDPPPMDLYLHLRLSYR
ncbi:unnamed protein product [Taenia asiatica]|uniref:Uncharacterized protein n=1 Tax=Taenia asiatica TaxID=60517 RepID=A0A0R3WFU0_TAEAS|nr:unnamed protein product [Taenia asiatica]